MSTTEARDPGAPETGVPDAVTFREIQEVIRTFQASGWRSMSLELRGLRVTVGKDGPPRTASDTRTASVPATEAGGQTAPGAGVAAAASEPAARAASDPTAGERSAPVARSGPAPSAQPDNGPTTAGSGAAGPPPSDPEIEGSVAVRSPAVGAFWVAPSPGQPPFVEVGQRVAADEQLAIVEVMKLMNPVLSPVAGEVVQVCATNSALVEYEEVLFWIRPDDDQ